MTTPLVPSIYPILGTVLSVAVRASLLVSPRPAALLVRRVFAAGGARTAQILSKHAPASGVTVCKDERYGNLRLDVLYPSDVSGPLPLLLWMHGGGWVGGSKDELTGYFKILASKGYVVAAPQYSLAPEHKYPTPLRQIMQALEFLQANAQGYHLNPSRIALAGDSAGAQIAGQVAALITTPGYAETVGVQPTVEATQLRGVVLACGAYDVKLAAQVGSPAGRRFVKALTWAYTGNRHFLTDPGSVAWSVTSNLTEAFPPVLITVGNADPLRPHSELLAQKLRTLGVDTQAVFFPPEHQPPLEHEYQFNLDTAEAQLFLKRLTAFLAQHL